MSPLHEPARTWVLLRGLAREASHWGDFGQRLAAQLDVRAQVLALDLPGNGALHRLPSQASVPAMATACRDQLAQRAVPPPVVLVAMSLGAMVALEWAHAAPAEVAGCVLINTSLRGTSPFWDRLRPHNYARLGALLRPGQPVVEREAAVLALTSSDPGRHAQLPAQWAEIAWQHPVTRHNALRQLLAAARYTPPPGKPAVPVLLLASAGDRLVSPRCSQRIAAQWSVPIKLHPAAGHDLPLDDPEWVLRQMADWWPSPGTGSRG